MTDTTPFALCVGLIAAILYIGTDYRQMNLCKATTMLVVSPIAFLMAFETISVCSLAFYLLTNLLVFKVLLTPACLFLTAFGVIFAALMYLCSKVVDDKGEHIVQCV